MRVIARCKPGKKKNYLRYSGKQYRLSVRRKAEKSEAFIDTYRWRRPVWRGSMSEYDRRTGVKKLRVRGMLAVRFCAKMKATGLNLLRAGPGSQGQDEGRRGYHPGLRSPYYDCCLSCQRTFTGRSGGICLRLDKFVGKISRKLQIGRLIFYGAINLMASNVSPK